MKPQLRNRTIVALLAGATTLVAPAAASANYSNPLKAWWPLAEGRGQITRDWSGNGNHGTLGATSQVDEHDPSWVRRRWGWALDFDGNDYVQIPESSDFNLQQLTVSLWFKGNSSPGTHRYLISKGGDACVSSSWALQTSWNGGLWFQLWNGSAQVWSGGADAEDVWDGRWHHAAGTWDGQRPKLYIDGKLVPGGNVSYETVEYDLDYQDAVLGAYRGDCELMFTGTLDQIMILSKPIEVDRIWNRWNWILGSPSS
jgi:hypothetical protein